jgi:hypothetical protein
MMDAFGKLSRNCPSNSIINKYSHVNDQFLRIGMLINGSTPLSFFIPLLGSYDGMKERRKNAEKKEKQRL